MMMDQGKVDKDIIKALLSALMQQKEEEPAGPYTEERRETSVDPEEVEGELYDEDQEISDDAEAEDMEAAADDDDDDGGGEEEVLKELVRKFMNGEDRDDEENRLKKASTLPLIAREILSSSAAVPPQPSKTMSIEMMAIKKPNKRGKK